MLALQLLTLRLVIITVSSTALNSELCSRSLHPIHGKDSTSNPFMWI